MRVRHFGFRGNRCRARRLPEIRAALQAPAPEAAELQDPARPFRLPLPQFSSGTEAGHRPSAATLPRSGRPDPLAALTAGEAQAQRIGRPAAWDCVRQKPWRSTDLGTQAPINGSSEPPGCPISAPTAAASP